MESLVYYLHHRNSSVGTDIVKCAFGCSFFHYHHLTMNKKVMWAMSLYSPPVPQEDRLQELSTIWFFVRNQINLILMYRTLYASSKITNHRYQPLSPGYRLPSAGQYFLRVVLSTWVSLISTFLLWSSCGGPEGAQEMMIKFQPQRNPSAQSKLTLLSEWWFVHSKSSLMFFQTVEVYTYYYIIT